MAAVGAEEFLLAVDVEDFDLGVGGGAEEEVGGVWEEADGGDGFRAVLPGVYEFLGVERAIDLDLLVRRMHHVRSAHVIGL